MINVTQHVVEIKSKHLKTSIKTDILVPINLQTNNTYPLLILNDGQDMEIMQMPHLLHQVWTKKVCKPFIMAAPHAQNRLEKYGVANKPDFKNRGKQAAAYTLFIIEELIPFVQTFLKQYGFSEHVMAGFSLGGLSAFDIGWQNAKVFSKVGVCSGSFWWRNKDLQKGYTDANRIMHQVIRLTEIKPDIKIWLQCGTLDEVADRNNNGIIDSIDDTLDLIIELEAKGFVKNKDLFYNELIGGKHTLETYGIVLPYFFQWAFGKPI